MPNGEHDEDIYSKVESDDRKGDGFIRKGRRPVSSASDADHPVARGIADGDHWLDAWLGQMCTPWETITRKTGITRARIEELNDDAVPTAKKV